MPNTLLFSFDDLAKAGPMAAVKKAFAKYLADPATIEAIPGTKRTSGISYRELTLTFSDSQTVLLRVKQSGDIYQVMLNGKALPITHQDDHPRAVREIVDALDAKRAAFQKALARRLAKLPPSVKTAAPKLQVVLTQRRDDLIVFRDGLQTQLADLLPVAA